MAAHRGQTERSGAEGQMRDTEAKALIEGLVDEVSDTETLDASALDVTQEDLRRMAKAFGMTEQELAEIFRSLE